MNKARNIRLSPSHTEKLTQKTLDIAFTLRTEVRISEVLHALIDRLCEEDEKDLQQLGRLINKNKRRARSADRRRRQRLSGSATD